MILLAIALSIHPQMVVSGPPTLTTSGTGNVEFTSLCTQEKSGMWTWSSKSGNGIAAPDRATCEMIAQRDLADEKAWENQAKPTDGEDPIYTVEPVTQKIPTCYAGKKLMRFEPAVNSGLTFGDPGSLGLSQPARWEDADVSAELPAPSGIYRCFTDESWTGPTKATVSAISVGDKCVYGNCTKGGDPEPAYTFLMPMGKPPKGIVHMLCIQKGNTYECEWDMPDSGETMTY